MPARRRRSQKAARLLPGRGAGIVKLASVAGASLRRRRETGETAMPDTESPIVQDGDLIQDEGEDASDDEFADPVRYIITSYGADMPVDALIKRLDLGNIFIPDFQRNFVWTRAQSSRFVESLLLGLPVPGIFLFKEPDTHKLMVVDGQQRLQTLHRFYREAFEEKKFHLIGVSQEFENRTYNSLSPVDQLRLDDSIIHATIFQQAEPGNDRSSIYSVFERLNTGGTPLTQQEIRACVYRGNFDDLLSEFAADPLWGELYGKRNVRKKDEEIILRFFSLYYCLENYEQPMKQFLNRFMEENRHVKKKESEFRRLFARTVKVASEGLKRGAFRPEGAFNVAVADAALVGLAHRLEKGGIMNCDALRSRHEELLDRLRAEGLHTMGTSRKDRVLKRIRYAREAYESVQ